MASHAGVKLRFNEWLFPIVRQHFLCRYKHIRSINAPTNVPQIRLQNKSSAQWNLIIFPFVRQQQQEGVLQVWEQEQARSETEDGAEFLAQAENIWIMLFNKWNCLHSPGFPSSSTFLWEQRDMRRRRRRRRRLYMGFVRSRHRISTWLAAIFSVQGNANASNCNYSEAIEIWNKLKGFINS